MKIYCSLYNDSFEHSYMVRIVYSFLCLECYNKLRHSNE